jgi:hypothetical protein
MALADFLGWQPSLVAWANLKMGYTGCRAHQRIPKSTSGTGSKSFPPAKTHPVSFFLVRIRLCPQLLDAEEQAHTISYLLDAHLLENLLIHLQQVLAIDVILAEYPLVLAAFYTPEIFANPVLVPVLDGAWAIGILKL